MFGDMFGPMNKDAFKVFKPSYMKKHYCLIPLVGSCAVAFALCGSYITYMITRKPDVSYRMPFIHGKHGTVGTPEEWLGPNEFRKFIVVNDQKCPPEVAKLREEIGSHRK